MNIRKLATAVVLNKDAEEVIKQAKMELREMPQEEVNKINAGNILHIARSPQSLTTYSPEYKEAEKELKLKYPPITKSIENHKITLTASNQVNSRCKLLIDNFSILTKHDLEELLKLYNEMEVK